MGLHLCYELALPPERSEQAVAALLEQLRQAAHRIQFGVISPIFHFTGAQCEPGPWGTGDQLEWFFKLFAHEAAADSPDPEYPRSVRANLALGFVVHPGLRCEAAAFGLARFPETVTAHPTDRPVETKGWHWHAACKTQYASVVSDDHLIRCHLSLVELLEEAARLGLGVTVRDETHYWETRDTRRLLEEVHAMNRIVARIAGRLGDSLPDNLRLGGSIVEHPRFERLEMGEDG
jgi:hypothetical protein